MSARGLDGATRLYGILGDPIASVRSPAVFNALFAEQGINAVLVPLHVGADELSQAWAGLTQVRNLDGFVITMPHKSRAVALLDDVGVAARVVGAVNAARREPDGRWTGDMFDGAGFVDGLRAQGHDPAGWRVRLHGLGGAGAAIAVALAQSGVAALTLRDADARREAALAAQLQDLFPALHLATGEATYEAFDAVVNATPLGMKEDDALSFDPAALPVDTLVVDIVTRLDTTPLLQRALDTGHRVHSGRHMHLGQARRVAQFFGHAVP